MPSPGIAGAVAVATSRTRRPREARSSGRRGPSAASSSADRRPRFVMLPVTKRGPSSTAVEHPGTTKALLCRAFRMPEEGLEPPTRGYDWRLGARFSAGLRQSRALRQASRASHPPSRRPIPGPGLAATGTDEPVARAQLRALEKPARRHGGRCARRCHSDARMTRRVSVAATPPRLRSWRTVSSRSVVSLHASSTM